VGDQCELTGAIKVKKKPKAGKRGKIAIEPGARLTFLKIRKKWVTVEHEGTKLFARPKHIKKSCKAVEAEAAPAASEEAPAAPEETPADEEAAPPADAPAEETPATPTEEAPAAPTEPAAATPPAEAPDQATVTPAEAPAAAAPAAKPDASPATQEPAPDAPAPEPAEEPASPDVTAEAPAQAEPEAPQRSRGHNLNTVGTNTIEPGSVLGTLAYRGASNLSDDSFHSALGLDTAGGIFAIGIRFGPFAHFDVGLLRTNDIGGFDHYEVDARYEIMQADEHYVDFTARVGMTWFSSAKENDMGFFGQGIASYPVLDDLDVGTTVTYHSNSSNSNKWPEDHDYTIAINIVGEYRVTSWLAWQIDLGSAIGGYGELNPSYATGPVFSGDTESLSLILTNTDMLDTSGVITNTARELTDVLLGLNFSRSF